ncbi:selenocysteine lyase-like [Oppia nitens]|uniref:selenocysteine lyase-like n=1 Tax=Oppia nitens TaxID=1686743 RepID=UPI0023DA184B|nr:selenocysteine lyase-like [Oppia nitens]
MIYLDYNATTPVDTQVVDTITDCLLNGWTNPSSSYATASCGVVDVRALIRTARSRVAAMINAADGDDIVFTSGGTEANNWVIYSSVRYYAKELTVSGDDRRRPHVITTNIEHDSICEPLRALMDDNIDSLVVRPINVTFVAVSTKTGSVSAEDIMNAVRPETCFVTVMMANNETGVIQPIADIARQLRKLNAQRVATGLPRILFHSDIAQAVGKIEVNVCELGVDFATIVGHKFYGPKIGALYRRNSVPLMPMLYGGGQESGLRPGTENVPMIVGLGKASDLVVNNLDKYRQHFAELQTYLETQLRNRFGKLIVINCDNCPNGRLPNTTSLSFCESHPIAGKILATTTSLRASMGAACHSHNMKKEIPSKVLLASGLSAELAQRTIRLSTGRQTTKDDIDRAIHDLSNTINKLLLNDK